MYKDGQELGDGLFVSIATGSDGTVYPAVSVYRCECGRQQTAKHPDFTCGLSTELAEKFGWRKIGGSWECPFCSGNTDNLYKLFGGA